MKLADILAQADAGYTCSLLTQDHFLMGFDCGHDHGLDDWLNKYANAYQAEGLAQVRVLSPLGDPSSVIGYFTLAAHTIETSAIGRRDRHNDALNGNIVNSLGRLPATLLGKFALDKGCQGKGLGNLLMACVYAEHLEAARHAGCKYLVVEARVPRVVTYYQDLGFTRSSGERDGLVSLYKATSVIKAEMNQILG